MPASGEATSVGQVEINDGPEAAKTQPEIYLALMQAMEDASNRMRRYLETGDVNEARRAVNAWLHIRVLLLRSRCDQMWSAVIGGDRPFSEEVRKKADARLQEIAAQCGEAVP